MKHTIRNYDGLYGEQHPAILPNFVQVERIETRSPRYKWVIKPHVHSQLFQLFCVEAGHGIIWSESGELPFAGPCLLLIPDSTLHGFRYLTETTGTVLTMSASFIDELTRTMPQVANPGGQVSVITLQQTQWFGYLQTLLHRIGEEAADNLPGRDVVLQALLTALLTDVFRYAQQRCQADASTKIRSLSILRAFQRSVRQSRNPQKNIKHYADEQHISPVHLNRVCRDVAQKSAMQIVYEYFLTEAQNYLIHTDFTIAEVAYQLNFDDAAYFSRLFKKQIGMTPTQFRLTSDIHQPHL